MDTKTFTKKYYRNRLNTNSNKWDEGVKQDALPMWVADMDFATADDIVGGLKKRIEHGAYGYSSLPDDYYDVFINWHKRRHSVTYKKDWIRFSNGAVHGLYQIILSMTKEKDAILVNTPAYHPFSLCCERTNRKFIPSPLKNNDGYFTFDYEDIEKKIVKNKVKVMILCSPHNPVGRVFKKGELEELFAITHKYGVLVISDEVHSDIIMKDQKFVPSLSFKKYQNEIITLTAASKTFNLALFSHNHVIIPNSELRAKYDAYQTYNKTKNVNVINALPTYFGYKSCDEWLDSLIEVVNENYRYIKEKLGKYVEITPLEGSYLIFINFGTYNKCKSANEMLVKQAHVLGNPGEEFAPGYENWVRLNLATSLANVKKAVKEIEKLLK